MNNYKKGKSYEAFVEYIHTAVLEAEKKAGNISTIKLERNITLKCKSGATAEIDIFWQYTIANIIFRVAIECKNHNKAVDVGEVREFALKIDSIGNMKGLMVAKNGFTENAKKEAEFYNIQLLIIREQKDSDWDGRLKKVRINLHTLLQSRTTKIDPVVNKAWANENGFKSGDTFSFSKRNDNIFIKEPSSNFHFSLFELEKHNFFSAHSTGIYKWERDFSDDGWLIISNQKIKLDKISITYEIPEPIQSSLSIDFSSYVVAIMEYIAENKKIALMKDGILKEFESCE